MPVSAVTSMRAIARVRTNGDNHRGYVCACIYYAKRTNDGITFMIMAFVQLILCWDIQRGAHVKMIPRIIVIVAE